MSDRPWEIISLCSGMGGLDVGVMRALAKRGQPSVVTAFSEYDPTDDAQFPAKAFEYRHPGVPNLGDIKKIDWHALRADVVTAGYPCQPFSEAGERRGVDDPRHLWPYVYEGIRTLRPRLTVLENVRGHRSKGFDVVLGDLAEGGFDVKWTSLRSSEIGAPHNRDRVFLLVRPSAHPDRDRSRGLPV